MAIVCPGCGREYDVTLFQFGRTIHCTCGHRLGLEQRLGALASEEPPRFIADAMLGRVARWLGTLGYDTAYDASIDDENLVPRALLERRHILTRDRRLPKEWRVEPRLVLSAEGAEGQPAERRRPGDCRGKRRWIWPANGC